MRHIKGTHYTNTPIRNHNSFFNPYVPNNESQYEPTLNITKIQWEVIIGLYGRWLTAFQWIFNFLAGLRHLQRSFVSRAQIIQANKNNTLRNSFVVCYFYLVFYSLCFVINLISLYLPNLNINKFHCKALFGQNIVTIVEHIHIYVLQRDQLIMTINNYISILHNRL